MKLPKRIENSPIVDALIEIRFETNIFKSAVFGLIYQEIMTDYPGQVTQLPILQLPEQIREQDPNLQFKPEYRIENEKFIIQIGRDVLCISSKIPYIGWDAFSNHAVYIISKLTNKGIIKRVSRLGHRYINFFEEKIWDHLTFVPLLIGDYEANNTLVRSELKDGDFINTIQISDNAKFKENEFVEEKYGSVIDIDTSREYGNNCFVENINNEINQSHLCEKKLFFSLLKSDFLNKYNPEYED